MEIYGTEATLSVPDSNTFGGPVRVKRVGAEWETVALKQCVDIFAALLEA